MGCPHPRDRRLQVFLVSGPQDPKARAGLFLGICFEHEVAQISKLCSNSDLTLAMNADTRAFLAPHLNYKLLQRKGLQ